MPLLFSISSVAFLLFYQTLPNKGVLCTLGAPDKKVTIFTINVYAALIAHGDEIPSTDYPKEAVRALKTVFSK